MFTADELDALETMMDMGIAKEKEEYDKEFKDRLIGLDEVALTERVKENAERQKHTTLAELCPILGTPAEVLARTCESSPDELSTPKYWLNWYRRTLATTEAAKRANRDLKPTTATPYTSIAALRSGGLARRVTEEETKG
ncbi:hypothetical protein PI124_g21493 [Phytophthora idaei]|nr:hypothetical protein PI125_g22899 [Phytophthora idaei]KAG3129403.1 hypothetical protein PI126_g20981 [Phytophthora idaei]KAG3233434.1 hypothetical protein PI124_g21493 [Phytophthora idaei]